TQADIAQGADRNLGPWRIDGHPAAITMFKPHYIIDIRIVRQKLRLDTPHCVIHHASDTLNSCGYGQDVACAYRPVRIAIAPESVAFERGHGRGHRSSHREVVQRTCRRHLE